MCESLTAYEVSDLVASPWSWSIYCLLHFFPAVPETHDTFRPYFFLPTSFPYVVWLLSSSTNDK